MSLRLCYEPAAWLERATRLRNLGYPELAAGDAHKARLLLQLKLDFLNGKRHYLGKRLQYLLV